MDRRVSPPNRHVNRPLDNIFFSINKTPNIEVNKKRKKNKEKKVDFHCGVITNKNVEIEIQGEIVKEDRSAGREPWELTE